MSRGFAAALAGIGLTILSWFGPWEWPAWPAFAVIRAFVGTQSNFADLPFTTRAAFVVLLIAVNVTAWALVVAATAALATAVFRRHHGIRAVRS